MRKHDVIYASPLDEIIDFNFDEKVVAVFPDMIQRSVPGYATLISTIGILAERYAQAGSRCYDLGCSLGAVTLSMRQRISQANCEIIAVDNSVAMIEQGQRLLNADQTSEVSVKMICADIQDVCIENASVVVLNFTLQFIPVNERLALIKRIYDGLKPGGILVLSEKLAFENAEIEQLHNELHHQFKRSNGYSDLEISQKRIALENVLIAETLGCHQHRLKEAGFNSNELWFQCFNFASIVAVK